MRSSKRKREEQDAPLDAVSEVATPRGNGYGDADMHEMALMECGAAAKTRRKLVLPPRGNGYS